MCWCINHLRISVGLGWFDQALLPINRVLPVVVVVEGISCKTHG